MHFSLGQVPISRCPPFFSCGCSKPFGTPWFRVPSLRIVKWALECSCVPKGVGATFCSKTGPFFSCGCSKASRVPVCPRRAKPHSAAKQGRSFRVAALNRVLSLRIEKWTLECSCVPKGVGATFCSKTGLIFSCGCSKPPSQALNSVPRSPDQKMDPRVLVCAQRGRGHILQQNRAVLFVCLL